MDSGSEPSGAANSGLSLRQKAALTTGAVILVHAAAGDWQSEVAREVTIQVRHVTGRPVLGASECDGGYLPDAADTCDAASALNAVLPNGRINTNIAAFTNANLDALDALDFDGFTAVAVGNIGIGAGNPIDTWTITEAKLLKNNIIGY